MNDRAVVLRRLAERVLAGGGQVPLAALLEAVVPVGKLRDLARRHGLSPKGGFRLEKAPARVLAPVLAEVRDARLLDEVLALLAPKEAGGAAAADAPAGAEPKDDVAGVLALQEAKVHRAREELERAREAVARSRDRESELQRRLQLAAEEIAALRAELDRARRGHGESSPRGEADRGLQRRLHELEAEREGFLAADAALRRQLAANQTKMRELADTVAELEPLVPKGKRRKRAPEPPPPPEDKRFRLPWFAPSFHRSLEGKDRKSVERAFHAILLFCTEGHSYPGLEVKQLGGQDTWSLRASLGLRVYFRTRPDGDVEFLELADREEQNTTLRRLKDR